MFSHRSLALVRLTISWDPPTEDDYKAAGATRVVALVKEDLEQEVQEFRPSSAGEADGMRL